MTSRTMRFRLGVAAELRRGRYLWDNAMEDRLGIQPMEPGRRRSLMRWVAWGAIALVYVVGGWANSSRTSFLRLLNHGDYTPTVFTLDKFATTLTRDLITVFLAVAFTLLFLRRARQAKPRVRPWTRIRTFFTYYCTFLSAIILATMTASVLHIPRYPYPDPIYPNDAMERLRIINSAFAGPAEETALLMLPVVALRRTGYSWRTVLIVAAVLRVPFHMYYGWTTVLFAVWAVGAVILYRRMASITPFILAHATHNTLGNLNDLGGGWELVQIIMVVNIVIGIVMVIRFHDRNLKDGLRVRRHYSAYWKSKMASATPQESGDVERSAKRVKSRQ